MNTNKLQPVPETPQITSLDQLNHLTLQPDLEIRKSALAVGRSVKHELESEKMVRRRSVEKILRIIVR